MSGYRAPTRELREHWFSRTVGDLLFANVLGALRDSADYFATVTTLQQQAEIQKTTTGALTGREAAWSGSEEDIAFQRRERQRLLAEHART